MINHAEDTSTNATFKTFLEGTDTVLQTDTNRNLP